MDESILSFLKSVAITDSRVQNTPRFIFLCGGKTRTKGAYLSARDFFFRYLKSNDQEVLKRVRLAEAVNDWFDHELFGDLLEVEEILADCSDLTVLFVESPGSIAELGAFAASPRLRPRTLAILNGEYDLQRTFIADGPVRRIQATDKDLVRYWRWNPRKPNGAEAISVFTDLSKDLAQLIAERSRSTPKQERVLRDSRGHTLFVIADYIDMVGISFRTEILDCLKLWGYDIDLKRIDQYLSLLVNFKLVRREPLSNQTYYLSRAQSPYIKHAFIPGTKNTDRDRIKAAIRESFEKNDARRVGVLRRDIDDRTKRARRSR